jgi:hypothetical protein
MFFLPQVNAATTKPKISLKSMLLPFDVISGVLTSFSASTTQNTGK